MPDYLLPVTLQTIIKFQSYKNVTEQSNLVIILIVSWCCSCSMEFRIVVTSSLFYFFLVVLISLN